MKRISLAIFGLCALTLGIVTSTKPANAQTVNCTGVAAWSGNSVAYAVGNLVTYQGSEYKCVQAHTSLSTWDPVDAASLWTKQGTCSTTTGTTTGATCAAAPAAPTGLAASGTTQTGTTLNWSAVTPPANCTISSYTIYKGGTSIGTATGTTFAVTGLTAGTTYTFTVAATDAFGTGSQSSSISVTTSSASCASVPAAPTGLAASGTTQTGTTLNWTAVTPPANCSISSYTIYKGGTSIGTSTSTSFAVTGLTASTAYTFTVAATDAAGTGSQSSSVSVTTSGTGTTCWAAWSSTATYTTGMQVSENNVNYTAAFWNTGTGSEPATHNGGAGTGQPWVSNGPCGGNSCAAAPGAPTGLAASSTTQTGTTLNWTAVTPPANCTISGYTIYKAGVSIGTSTGTSFAVTGLTASTTYTFTVAATDSFGTGGQSSSVSVTTLANSCTAVPAAPTGLASSGTTQTGTTLSWSAVTAPSGCTITGYTIYKAGVSIGTSTSTSFAVTGLTASTTYTFTVAATDAAGTGAQSSSISVTTLANVSCTSVPSAPTGLAASGTTNTSTTLNWGAVTPPANCTISGYTVYKGGVALATVSSGTSYTVTGLTANTTYSFTVAAVDAAGSSSQSSSVSVTTTNVTAGPIKNAVIGYWDNWGTFTMPNTSMNYKVINYAFAVGSGTDGATMVMWTPSATNPLSSAAADIAATKAQGRTVILSLGGATSPNITLLNSTDVANFVSSVENCVDTYGFQGIDLDFENASVTVNAGDNLANPTTPDIAFMSQALHQLKSHYGPNFLITYVPETADIDAYGAFGGFWGGYLALVNATRDIMTFCDIQCYNSGSMNAANGQVVSAGGADFLVAMSELLLHGYTVSGGQNFAALAPGQVAFGNLYNGTPSSAAVAAYKYLTAGTPDGGSYTRIGGPYPNMAGVMIWDINGDATNGYAYSTALKNGGLTGN